MKALYTKRRSGYSLGPNMKFKLESFKISTDASNMADKDGQKGL